MPQVTLYTKPYCPFCTMAKRLLESKGQEYEEINLSQHPERTDEMIERSGGKMSVPEIFISGKLIGGFDDLAALETAGKLDPLLA